MDDVMLRNITSPGNCLGTTGELSGVVARHAAGLFPVTIDSVFRDDPAGLLDRIHTSADRFGEVAFLHA